jgi:deazaflavin-dependent oxidoreductase (nitroreductase family)
MRYRKPDFLTANVFNPLLRALVRLGFSPRGARILEVRGRRSGEWRSTPVNPLELGGARYLVGPRGNTHWARNLRAGGEARLRLGGKRETIEVEELPDEAKPPILRAYLKHWRSETGKFFEVSKDPTDEELRRIAPNHPVFLVRRP